MIFRKMLKNKWLELSLLFGLILSVALASSMPIYTEAILQRMLVKELEQYQQTTGTYPLMHRTGLYFLGETAKENGEQALRADEFMRSIQDDFRLPQMEYLMERSTDSFLFVPVDPERVDATMRRTADIVALSGLENHIRLIDGRLPAKEPVDGVYEALVVEGALTRLNMVLGNEFVIQDERVPEPIIVKPVGVINVKDEEDIYWFNSISSYSSSFIVDFDLFEKYITKGENITLRLAAYYSAFEYSRMNMDSIVSFLWTNSRIDNFISQLNSSNSIRAPAMEVISKYLDREKQLRIMLWSLNVPVMIMLAFYLYMVSNLIIERQKTEIAVLRSRGASRLQVLFSYVLEGLILGTIAFIVGPYVGMLLTKFLGASNGFLEFVQRTALIVEINETAYKYSLYAVLFSLVMTLIPALLATRTSIVGHKQQMARSEKKSFWHKFFIDIILIAVSLYGLQDFKRRMQDLQALGLDSTSLQVDPLLFLVPALFTLGMGLFLLRIYPWFIRFVYWAGKRIWPPALYQTLIQVGRANTQYQFLMVFLIITLATGLFSASAARTLNNNTLEKVEYKNGADVVLTVRWENDAPLGGGGMEELDPESGESQGQSPAIAAPRRVQYAEPPFEMFKELPGVVNAARVFTKQNATAVANKSTFRVTLMGIDTDDFGRVALMKDGLLDHHFYSYLNLISTDPTAVLISRTLADQQNVRVGDTIELGWDSVGSKSFVVYGIVDYWPSFNPNPQQTSGGNKPAAPMLAVAHLSYIQSGLALEPYDVWIDLSDEPGIRQKFNDALYEREIPVQNLIDTTYELTMAKNDPFQLAINGVMTLGFLISVVISFFGFLLYWILSLNSRVLQYGILRAMGISFLQLIGMLLTEQILTSGAAFVLGAGIGTLTSRLFVPLFQLSFSPAQQVPPFEVTFDPSDSIRLYIIVTVMITAGLAILAYLLSRIKIHQAVKLGED
jgi:putative ABC transport system permease protein